MITVEDLHFTYPGTSAATLTGVGFSVPPGQVYGLLGPSGAGKSTTQKILLGLLRGFTGAVSLFGQPIAAMDRSFYGRIGVSFELPTLYLRLTARENLQLFAALYDRPTRDPLEVLEMVDLADAADQRVDSFSKGMKMRLNLCRALIHDPDLLFLDEPTTGQDPARAHVTRDLIKRLRAEGKTILLTTHNMAEADEICDRVGFLANGTIPVSGKPEDLKRRYGRQIVEVGYKAPIGIEKVQFPMKNIGTNAEFIEMLGTGEVVSIHTLEASLDDVFILSTRPDRKAAQ